MRKSIDDLVPVVADGIGLDPRARSLFCFCGGRADRYKVLAFDGDTRSHALRRLEGRSPRRPHAEGSLWKPGRAALFRLLAGERLTEGDALVAFGRIA